MILRERDPIPSGFIDLRIKQTKIRNMIKHAYKNTDASEKIKNIIKDKIDNKYLKFISIEKNSIVFKANKKFREKMSDDSEFDSSYITEFLSTILQEMDIILKKNQIAIICDIFIYRDNKITIEF